MTLRVKMAILTAALTVIGIGLAGVLSVVVAHQFLMRDVRGVLEQRLQSAASRTAAMLLPPGSVSLVGQGPHPLPRQIPVFGRVRKWILASAELPSGAVIVVAAPSSTVTTPQQRLEGAVWRVDLAVSAIGALVAFWLAGGALLPLGRMAETARAISTPGGLEEDIVWPEGQDEVGQLGVALHTMLERLAQAFHELEASRRREQQFLADAGHDLRTPLTIIRGNLHILAREDATPEIRSAALRDALSESVRLSELMEHLLLLGPLSEGRLLSGQSRPLMTIVREATARWRPRFGEQTLELRGDDVAAAVPVDLQRVLDILLDNALKYGDTNAPVVVETSEQDGSVVLSVIDHGRGIAAKELPFIFDRFYRSDHARQRGGYGLGLAIARAIVEAAGGTITATSELGHGTEMRISVPRAGAAHAVKRSDPQGDGDSPSETAGHHP